ncbi:uncharacterized protein LOC128389785 isoform X2 [Panonychus citri]|nr:uncharacterized protein LOC128389785 isoform X2 [Panonychus citri]
MELQADDKNKILSNLDGIKLENTMCTSERTQNLQHEDRSYENKSKVLLSKSPKHQQFNKLIRKPNEAQFITYHYYFHSKPQGSPQLALSEINMRRELQEDEWTLTNFYATYQILLMGRDLLKTKIDPKKQIRLYGNSNVERYFNEKIRMPNDDQLDQFHLHFHSKTSTTPQNFLAHINITRHSNEPEWSLVNLFSTYELLIMGSRFKKLPSAKPSREYVKAEEEIRKFYLSTEFRSS